MCCCCCGCCRSCGGCHGEKKQKADIALHDASFDFSKIENVDLWKGVLKKTLLGEMPPENKERPDPKKLDAFVSWTDVHPVECTRTPKGHLVPIEASIRTWVTNIVWWSVSMNRALRRRHVVVPLN